MIQWQADARLLDGADMDALIGQSTHPFVGQGVITNGTVTDTHSARERRWRFDEQLLTLQAVWTGVFDTRAVIGKPVKLGMYLVGSFVNPDEYTLPGEWGFSVDRVQYSAVEEGYGSGLPTPAP